MKLLVIGGSIFLGRHLVSQALERGDTVTVFNRGQTAITWPAAVEVRHGDRKGDLAALAVGDWDAVVDCCGYLPRDVACMADCLGARVRRYAFISSISVYAAFGRPNDESSPLGVIEDRDTDVVDSRTYGPLKALCEQVVTARFADERALLIRPGLIVGPHDPTQRFTYWPARIARAAADEPVLVPGTPDTGLQFIDVRDLADFVLQALDRGLGGTYNLTSAPGAVSMGALLDACAAAAGTRPHWRWTTPEDVEACGLQPWSDLPVWVPPLGDGAALHRTDTRRAQAAGLRMRTLAETVADTLAWYRSLPGEQRAFTKAGLSPTREAEALQRLQALSAKNAARTSAGN